MDVHSDSVRALLTTLCVSILIASASPGAEYSQRVWRIEDGLPQNKIQAFAQTPDGYLWIGTAGGLVRFDGARFTVFDRSIVPALGDDSITSLLAARDGSLWIGTEGGGLTHMVHGTFRRYGSAEGLSNGFVRTLLEDPGGRLWLGTDRGFFAFENGRFVRFDGRGDTPILAARSMWRDGSGKLWVGTSYGLFSFEGDRLVRASADQVGTISSIFGAKDGQLWVASGSGLRRLVAGSLVADTRPVTLHPTTIYGGRSGEMWVGTLSAGLVKISGTGASVLKAPDPLPDNTVLAIFEDPQKNIWVGTQDGLLRLTETTVKTINTKDGLSENSVATVYGDPSGSIWLSTISSLLYKLDGDRPVRFEPPPSQANFHPRNIFVSRDGVQWIGSTMQGVLRVEHGAARLFSMADGLRSNSIRHILQDRKGIIWIATGSGLSRWDGHAIKTFYIEDGLAYGGVRVLAEDANGDLLVGTDGGLNRVRDSRFVKDDVFARLGAQRVWSMLPDANGVLWLGTRGDGLVRIERGVITHYTAREGLPSNSIYQILDDHAGRLWMSSAAGVFSASRRDLDAFAHGTPGPIPVAPYGTDDGMLSSEMYGGVQTAGCRDANGRLWFPSVKGAVRIEPAQLRMSHAAPVLIESITVDERPISLNGDIVIPPGGNRIEIDFASPSLAGPGRVSFRYMLEGFDKSWIPSLKSHAASYTNLPPRRYRFRVIAQDVAQPGHTSEASVSFVLKPSFVQSGWFALLMTVLAGLFIFGAFRWYARQTKARYALVLAERTRLAREMHDTVIQGCVGVSTLLEAARSMPSSAQPKAKELVDRAATQIRVTVNEAREAVWDLRHSTIEHGLAETLRDFAQQVSASEGVAVQTQIEGAPARLDEAAGRNLLLVAREAVRNAVLHGAPDRISVKLHFEVSEVCLEVSDNGCGFRPEQPRPDGHYGIVGMRERVEQSGGRFELRSIPGTGTSVSARLPLKNGRKHG